MFELLLLVEKMIRGLRIVVKLSYYKVKYGGRLKLGKGVHFRKGFIINISKHGRLEIGDGTCFNNYCSINCHEEIAIGRGNIFGESVKIYDHNHVFNDRSVDMKRCFKTNKITIGNDNWFGSNVIILSKAKVGSNNVFGGGVIVNSKYGSDSLVRFRQRLIIEDIIYR